jgi:hypothetical protein
MAVVGELMVLVGVNNGPLLAGAGRGADTAGRYGEALELGLCGGQTGASWRSVSGRERRYATVTGPVASTIGRGRSGGRRRGAPGQPAT